MNDKKFYLDDEEGGYSPQFAAPEDRRAISQALPERAVSSSAGNQELQFEIAEMTKGLPTDPDVMAPGQSQWHLVGTWGLHADKVWADYTGAGIRVGVLDDGFQYTHSEIAANYRTDLDRDIFGNDADAAPVYAEDNHGTAVIGTIIGDDNGVGTVGVAFDAQAYGMRIDLHGHGGTMGHIISAFQYAATTGLDVMNNSWGFSTAYSDTINLDLRGPDYLDIRNAMINLVNNGREGLGSNIVFAAGNSRSSGDNVNYHNLINSPYTVAVAAIDSDGTYSSFSTPGASLLVAAGGTSVYTTDRTGAAGYRSGDYMNFSGTSAAAPVVSGAIAVMLEANGDLGWRDVREILAYSAQHNDATSARWQYNGAGNWNGGGLHFNHDYGFGAVDLRAAVRLAETWDLQQTSANMTTLAPVTSSSSRAIPATGTVTSTINILQDVEIEHVSVYLDIDHPRAGNLIVTLISPDGTESVLVNNPKNGNFTSANGVTGIHFHTNSNAHWGESSLGTWTLRVTDTAGTDAGVLKSWKLGFMGNAQTADNVYIYTDDYGNFSGAELAARQTLSDAGGTDTINLAAVTANTRLDMNAGAASMVSGKTLNIAAGTLIENAYLGDGNDNVTGNAANNVIYGGRGSDTMDGGNGTDTAGFLESIVNFVFSFISSVTVQVTTIIGTAWTDVLTNFERFIFGDDAYTRAELEAYAGAGTPPKMQATNGADTLNGDATSETISGLGGDDTIHGNGGDDIVNGDAGNDILFGDAGNDTLNGGTGSDTMDGGYGTDTAEFLEPIVNFVFSFINSVTVQVTTTIGTLWTDVLTNFERFIFGGNAYTRAELEAYVGVPTKTPATNGADTLNGDATSETISGLDGDDTIHGNDGDDIINGDAGNDILFGDAGNDTLNGGTGSDTMRGGLGNDTYVVDNALDVVIESLGAGTDTVKSSLSYTLGTNVEALILTGSAAINATGNTLSNMLTGNSAANILNGGTGADTMAGGAGNDAYIIDNIGDIVTESAGGGTDTVSSTVTHTLAAEVENLVLLGSAMLNGTGNALDNFLTGNAGSNILDGSLGADTMSGGAGSDTYIIDNIGDIVTENAAAGTDTVRSGLSYTLGSNVENLVLTGTAAINGTGNTLTNVLTGNSGNNILNGGTGADRMSGGAGNDIYIVDNTGDRIVELAGGGTDIVNSSTSHVLSTNIENLTLTGAVNINGTGNVLANVLTGNSGNNILNGGSGNDTLYGGAGMDTLTGGIGNDVLYGQEGVDTLSGGTGSDRFVFESASAFTDIDKVSYFNLAEGDMIDISDVLEGYDPMTDLLSDFVEITNSGSNSLLKVDRDGAGTAYGFTQIATLNGISNLTNEDALVASGNLIVS